MIRPGTAGSGLFLGAAQPAGGIIGSGTDTFTGTPIGLVTLSAPTLTFAGTATGAGTRALTGGDLSGLRLILNGSTYNAGTGFGPGPDRTQPLTGEITGSTTGSNTIRLNWTTRLTEPGFNILRTQFQLVGTYHH